MELQSRHQVSVIHVLFFFVFLLLSLKKRIGSCFCTNLSISFFIISALFPCPASGGAEYESAAPPVTENGALDSSNSKEEVEEKDKGEDTEVKQEEVNKHTHTRTQTQLHR